MQPWRWQTRWLSILVVVALGLSACSRLKNPSAKNSPSPKPIAAVFQTSVWDAEPDAKITPKLAIYEDGRGIFRHDQTYNPLTHTSYWTYRLTLDELQELNAHIVAAVSDPAVKDSYEFSPVTDGPTTAFFFSGVSESMSVRAHCFWLDGEFTWEPYLDFENQIPPSLVEYHRLISKLLKPSQPIIPWKPSAMIATLWPAAQSVGQGVPWPAHWPAWKSGHPWGIGGVQFILPVSPQKEFWSVFPHELVTVEGKT